MVKRKYNVLQLNLVFILLIVTLTGCNFEKSDSPSGKAGDLSDRSAEIALHKYQGVLRSVEAQIGSDKVPFLFDTGGGLTLITPELADQIGCVPFGRITGFRMTGERLDFQRCGQVEFKIEDVLFKVETVVFDLMSLLPEKWPKLGGIFSLDTFGNHSITLDLSKDRLTIETKDSLANRITSMKPLNIRINHQTGGWGLDIFVEIAAERGSLWLELDSGNMGEVLLAPHAIEQLGLAVPVSDKITNDPVSDVFDTTIHVVGLGPLDVKARMRELIYDGALNAAFMEKLIITMDLKNGNAWAKLSDHE